MSDVQPQTTYKERLHQFFIEAGEKFTLEEVLENLDLFAEKEKERKRKQFDKMPVGKYKYKLIKDVCKFDKKYIEWSVKQSFMEAYPECLDEMKKYL